MDLNTIYNEDCEETMKRMEDKFVDLTVTSPPYDKMRDYEGFSFNFKEIATQLYRITKDGGIVIWVVGDSTNNGSESLTSFKQAIFFNEIGFNLHDTMIYKKKNYVPLNHNRYEQHFEYMFCFSKGKPKTFNPIMLPSKTSGEVSNLQRKGYGFRNGSFRRRNQDVKTKPFKVHGNIFEYATGNSGCDHPAVFPEKLAEDQILTWSNEGNLVYDPFSGSGTTCKMAKLKKRDFIGSEISEKYTLSSQKRLTNLTIHLF